MTREELLTTGRQMAHEENIDRSFAFSRCGVRQEGRKAQREVRRDPAATRELSTTLGTDVEYAPASLRVVPRKLEPLAARLLDIQDMNVPEDLLDVLEPEVRFRKNGKNSCGATTRRKVSAAGDGRSSITISWATWCADKPSATIEAISVITSFPADATSSCTRLMPFGYS